MTSATARPTPKTHWADSYSHKGECYIKSTFDHGIGGVKVPTPHGKRTVRQVAAALGKGPGSAGNPIYNDVQCGNGPPNNAGDEDPSQCPGRVDLGKAGCTVKGPKWNLLRAFPVTAVAPTATTPAVGKTPTFSPQACSVTETKLRDALREFTKQCPTSKYRDCDLIKGRWQCSSERIGHAGLYPIKITPVKPITIPEKPTTECSPSAPDKEITPPLPPVTPPVSAPEPTPPANVPYTGTNSVRIEVESKSALGWVKKSTYSVWIKGNHYKAPPSTAAMTYEFVVPRTGVYDLRIRAKAMRQTPGRQDLHNDAWIKLGGEYIKVFTSGDGNWHVKTDSRFRQKFVAGTTYTLYLKGRSAGYGIDYLEIVPVSNPPVSAGKYKEGDLVMLHHDNGPDPDDLQAIIANREILNEFPNVDVMVVGGTKGYLISKPLEGSIEHMRQLFPDTLDAYITPVDTIMRVATAWQITIESGHKVWVAEGGPSDFTARVLRELRDRGVVDLKRVNVIQHAHGAGWNEKHTRADNMALVKRLATYVTIPNGNSGGGSVNSKNADLNAGRTGSEAEKFRRLALNSQYKEQWKFAFNRLRNKVDFSDTVELMYILGIKTTGAYNTGHFARDYF